MSVCYSQAVLADVSYASQKVVSEDLRSRVVDIHVAGKGHRVTSKTSDIHQSTVRQIVYKWRYVTMATLHRSGHPAKAPKAHCRMFNEVKKNPRETGIWGSFASSGPGPLAIVEGKINSQIYQDIYRIISMCL